MGVPTVAQVLVRVETNRLGKDSHGRTVSKLGYTVKSLF